MVAAQDWLGKGIKDGPLLAALAAEGRALVTKDRSTMGGELKQRQAAGEDHAGVLFWDDERFAPRKWVLVGALADAVVRAVTAFGGELRGVIYTLR